jgi:hypothetical protein
MTIATMIAVMKIRPLMLVTPFPLASIWYSELGQVEDYLD